jgi:hypothetical protein
MIDMNKISPELAELFSRSGWSSDRRVETSWWIASLESEGFRSNSTALAILESIGGMSVHMPPFGISPYEHEVRFDPILAATGEFDRTTGWRDELEVELFPLGYEIRSGNILWSGNNGQFYFGRDLGLYHLGDSFNDAMKQLAFPVAPLNQCAE